MSAGPRIASPCRRGWSLIEMLIVLGLVGVLAGMVVSASKPSAREQLKAGAQIVAADVAYCRSLAMMNNSKYTLTYYSGANQYVLTHTGTNSALDMLPRNPQRMGLDAPNLYRVDLDEFPELGSRVYIAALRGMGTPIQSVNTIEFGPLGETTRTAPTVIWLVADPYGRRTYLQIEINPVTGLAKIGEPQRTGPPPGAP